MPFKPGNRANPNGRPKGAKDRLQNNFLVALAEDFKENGKAAIVKMRETDPSGYIRAIVSLVPKELDITRRDASPFDQLSDEELLAIRDEARRIAGLGTTGVSEAGPEEPGIVH